MCQGSYPHPPRVNIVILLQQVSRVNIFLNQVSVVSFPSTSIYFIILLHRVFVLSSSSTEYLFYHPPPLYFCFVCLLHRVSVLSFLSTEYLFYHPPPPSICFVILLQGVAGLSPSSTNCPTGGACEGDHHLEWPAPPDHSCRPETEGPEDPEAALLPRGPLATVTIIHHPLHCGL